VSGLRLENIVCEVPQLGIEPGFSWYEIDASVLDEDVGSAPDGGNAIAVTCDSHWSRLEPLLDRLVDTCVGHVQFEVGDWTDVGAIIERARGLGVEPIPAAHTGRPPESEDELNRTIARLSELDATIVKVAYPAERAEQARWGVDALRSWDQGRIGLAVTPMGTRAGRVAAALAGSRLVHAGVHATPERPSAAWFRQLAEDTARQRAGEPL